MDLALLVLRVIVGVLFIGHGTQKLFGWFGGHGLDGTGGFFESLGLKPGKAMAFAAGFNEAVGGLLLALGLITPVAAALLTATMVVAIATVHYANGPWATSNGYEYNLALIAVFTTISAFDAGKYSLDNAINLGATGTKWFLIPLGAGIVGGALAVLTGRLQARRAESGAQARTA
jgi:putative oxidoreductase